MRENPDQPEAATTTDVPVDPTNIDQLRAWDGETGDYWAANAERYDAAVARYHGQLLDAASIEPTDRVLDIGCGSGQTTRDAARLASLGRALGVDLSSRMLELARRLAARDGIRNASFQRADAQHHVFAEGSFDVAVSRHGAMFFGDPVAAFRNIARALRPGGRLVLLTWQSFELNEWIRSFFAALAVGRNLPVPPPTAPGPFALSNPDRVRELLTSAGFTDVRLRGLAEPMYFGAAPDDACQFISGQFDWLVRDLDTNSRAEALDALRADMATHHTERGVHYNSAAWLVNARRPG